MPSSSDSAVRGAEDVEDDAHNQEDHAERVEDAHAEHDPEQQQDESQNDHQVPFVSAVCAQSWRGLAKGQGAMTDPDAAATRGSASSSSRYVLCGEHGAAAGGVHLVASH